ncbi:hypothetical protein L228DRAFT_94789 [Xylona heveae TC161]|uniref:histidine kinase n=1 Tax=Xylona heveae (strain CBS 132557 / TC161) TaxID=1328760 RepID=A0A165I3R9_XYLHT|nr:hypothetical protein L228DRAFT_94789 [Xylona heveae TC161]KZF24338.1 hypothetical protein L228DRAFT_94789 [Xylona heveae TC161]
MRIPIREQLGLLVLTTTLTALAVVAIATWVNNYNFVLGIRSSRLTITASLKASQLASSLLILQSSAQTISTRVLLQNALQRYNNGNNTYANWARAISDLQSAMAAGGQQALLLQAMVYPKNDSGFAGPWSLLNVTGDPSGNGIILPDTGVPFGTNGSGYPAAIYPNLTYTTTVVNSTYNASVAYVFNDTDYERVLKPDSTLLLGPLRINDTFALLSLTLPVINNTSATDILGYVTVVANARMIYDVVESLVGLDKTGVTLVAGPLSPTNRFPSSLMINGSRQIAPQDMDIPVEYIFTPSTSSSRVKKLPFSMESFQMRENRGIADAFGKNNGELNNAGTIISTKSETGHKIAVGYALVESRLCNWALLVEQAHSEVWAPINHLRNVLLACVFGTAGAILLILLPLAHFSVRPIRELREATKKTIQPPSYSPDDESLRSFGSDIQDPVPGEDTELAEEHKGASFFIPMVKWRFGGQKSDRKRRRDSRREAFRIPGKVQERKHLVKDELSDLTQTFNAMSDELMMQYERLEERVKIRTQELELSKKAAEAANESKTLFIANISHELKTPLNGILGMCAVCMQEDDQSKIRQSLRIIYKSGDLLLHLLNDLLTFSKNQMGQQLSLDEREFRLADISSQIMSIFDKQAKEGHINLNVTFLGPMEVLEKNGPATGEKGYHPIGLGRVRDMCVWGDQHRILQVIINLVNNSLKFTPPGGSVELRIKCLGEVEEKAESRKGSVQSRFSKQLSSRNSRKRHDSGSNSVVSDPEKPKNMDTVLSINPMEGPRLPPSAATIERSSSPPLINARTLVFEFDIEDTGPGIPEHLRDRIFEPFMQGDLGLSRKYGGTGLGLSICSQLATLMKGSIHLKSEEGVGSTFSMKIPLKYTRDRANSTTSSSVDLHSGRNSVNMTRGVDDSPPKGDVDDASTAIAITNAHSATTSVGSDTGPRLVGFSQPYFAPDPPLDNAKEQKAAIERATAEASSRSGRIKVLVAEDNIVNQEVVLRMLKLEDIYDVTVAKDGQEALDLVKESMEKNQLYNLIFMDIQMPNLDGLQSTRLIRSIGYSAPIVALTAFSEESNVKECMDSGMNYFLAKPIRRPALKQVLKTYCAPIPEVEEGESSAHNSNTKPPEDRPRSPEPSPLSS